MLIVGLLLAVMVYRFATGFFHSAEPTEDELYEEAAEVAGHVLQSREAGKKAGYEDCENDRYNGATANPTGWDGEAYSDGYEYGYSECSASRKAYEQGKKDGEEDCHWSRRGEGWYQGDAWQSVFDFLDHENDYQRRCDEGYGRMGYYAP